VVRARENERWCRVAGEAAEEGGGGGGGGGVGSGGQAVEHVLLLGGGEGAGSGGGGGVASGGQVVEQEERWCSVCRVEFASAQDLVAHRRALQVSQNARSVY
jgi:hypothetical protein